MIKLFTISLFVMILTGIYGIDEKFIFINLLWLIFSITENKKLWNQKSGNT